MIKNVFGAIASSTRALFRSWRALIIFFLLYAALLGAVYLFFATREASVGQLLLSVALAVAAPLLFFVLQAMAVRYVSTQGHAKTLTLSALRGFWKILLISLAPIVIIGLIVYLLGLIDVSPDKAAATLTPPRATTVKPAPPLQWQAVSVTSVQYLLLCLILPLMLIHMWIATARDGMKAAIEGIVRILGRALAPSSVLTYAIGFVVFAVAPYFLLFNKTEAAGAWLDAGLFGARLALAVLLSLVGWIVTLGALATADTGSAGTESTGEAIEGSERVPVGS